MAGVLATWEQELWLHEPNKEIRKERKGEYGEWEIRGVKDWSRKGGEEGIKGRESEDKERGKVRN